MTRAHRFVASTALALLAGSACGQTTFTVPSAQAPTLQFILESPASTLAQGDTIVLTEAGFYLGTFTIDTPDVTIEAAEGADIVLDALGEGLPIGVFVGSVLTAGPNADGLTLRGLTVRGGKAPLGGGLYISDNVDVTIEDCVFETNVAGNDGGGVYAEDGTNVVIRRTIFRNNAATSEVAIPSDGGGVYARSASVTIEDCTFDGNTAVADGGGVAFFICDAQIQRTLFVRNAAGFDGGGIWASAGSDGRIVDSEFVYNTAGMDGGGSRFENSGVETIRSRFHANVAERFGGAISAFGEIAGGDNENDVFDSVFVGNRATNGSVYIAETGPDPLILNCTVVDNICTGVAESGTFVNTGGAAGIAIRNSIMRGNVPRAHDTNPVASTAFQYCNLQEPDASVFNSVGNANIDADPMFIAAPSDGGDGWGDNPATIDIDESLNDDFGDLRLMRDSPSIDAGDANLIAISANPVDIAGLARVIGIDGFDPDVDAGEGVFGQVPDHGAHEVQATSTQGALVDVNGDGFIDFFDVVAWLGLFDAAFNGG